MTATASDRIERSGGVALWRQIADQMRAVIGTGGFPGDRLPGEVVLAGRFGVNRHTVRQAIAHLAQQGLVRPVQGRGTFVLPQRRLNYPIARRTRFAAGLEGQAAELRMRLLRHVTEPAGAWQAGALGVADGAPVVRMDALSSADGVPIALATHWFDAGRFAAMPALFAQSGSITDAFAQLGVPDYVRRSTTITAIHGPPADLDALGVAPGVILLVAEGVNVDTAGRPIQCSRTRFVAERMALTIDGA